MNLNKNFIILFLLIPFSSLFAQQVKQVKDTTDVEKLDEVIVTATRTIRQLSSLPMPVQMVSKADIQSSNSVRLSDILSEQTGLTTVSDFGGVEGIQLQGLDSQYTLILIDGVPLIGRSAGTLDLNRLTVGNIKQIEIVKGPSSSLYGSDALGGVINIITNTPKFGTRGNVHVRGGSNDTYDVGASVNHRKDKLGLSFFANRYSSSGYDLDSNDGFADVLPFSNYTFDSKLTYKFSRKTNLILSGRYFTQNQDYNGGTSLLGESSRKDWNIRTNISHQHNDVWNSTLELYASRYKADEFLNNADGSLNSESFFNQFFFRPEYRTNIETNDHILSFGLGITHETLDRTLFSVKPIYNAPYVYGQYDLNFSEKLNVIVGTRFDSHNVYKSQFNPKIAANYKLGNKTSIKGSVGRGFKAPDFRQLYFNFNNSAGGYVLLGHQVVRDYINEGSLTLTDEYLRGKFFEDLKPESSWGYNFGIDHRLSESYSITLSLFRNDITNQIDTRFLNQQFQGGRAFSYININKAYTQGLEFNIFWRPNESWKLSGGYQLMWAKDKEGEEKFENGEVFARDQVTNQSFQLTKSDYFGLFNRSRHMANVKVFYKLPEKGLDANIRAVYRSKFGLFDTNSNNYLDKYDEFISGNIMVDVAVNKELFNKQNHGIDLSVGVGADNIFGFTNNLLTNIPGRLLYGKLNIQF